MKRVPLLLALALLSFPALAGPSPYSAAALDWTVAKGIAAGFISEPIDMAPGGSEGPMFTRLSIPLTVVWGTSTDFELRLLGCDTVGGTYSVVTRCTSADVHVCKPRRWSFAAADWAGIAPRLDTVGTGYRYLRIQLVAGAGTGTVLATATRAP